MKEKNDASVMLVDPPTGIVIVVTRNEESYTAECNTLDIFGTGDNLLQALQDLMDSIKDSYELFQEHENNLSNYAENLFKHYKNWMRSP